MNHYQPPLSFWSEVRRQDRKLFSMGENLPPEKISVIPFRVKAALWGSDDKENKSPILWTTHYNTLLGRCASRLQAHEFVTSDVSSELGVMIHTFAYSTALHAIRTTVFMVPNIDSETHEESLPMARESRSIENLFGKSALTEEDCERFIAELKRGASGEFAVPLPPSIKE